MFERFTEPARSVVERASRIAQDARADQTRPEHLLAALLEDEQCLATGVLAGLGAAPRDLRVELERLRARYVDGLDADDAEALAAIGIDLEEVVRRIDRHLAAGSTLARRPRFARGSKKAIELALREAIALRHHYIGTEHLLLGLVRGGDRLVLDTLRSAGVERDVLRAAVAEAVRRAGEQAG